MKKPKIVAIDLETIPNMDLVSLLPEPKPKGNLKDPKKIDADISEKKEKQIDDMGLNPMFNRVCVAGLYSNIASNYSIILEIETDDAESILLMELYDVLQSYDYIVTFNGRNFDMKVLNLHNMRLGIKPGITLDMGRYNTASSNHIDLRQVVFGSEMFAKGDLDTAAKVFLSGDSKSEGIDGKLVRDWWLMGDKQSIAEYCIQDCKLTYDLCMRAIECGLINWI